MNLVLKGKKTSYNINIIGGFNLDIPIINTPQVHINSILAQYIKINDR